MRRWDERCVESVRVCGAVEMLMWMAVSEGLSGSDVGMEG